MRIAGLFAQEAYDAAGTNEADPLSVAHLEADSAMSLEEAALVLADCGEHASGIRRDLQESERLIQLSDALEELCLVAKDIKAATPAEARLLEIAGQLVVAGSEVEADRVVPAMEGFIGLSISTEGLESIILTAKRIWESIQAFVQRVWAKIRNFYHASVVSTKYGSMIEELKAEVAKAGESHPEKTTFNISGASSGLMIDITTPQGWDHLNEELKRFVGIDEAIFKGYASNVLDRGAEIVKAINEFDPKIPAKAADALKEKLVGMHSKTFEGQTKFLGNGRLDVQSYEKLGGEDAAVALERLRLSGIKYSKLPTAATIEQGKDELHGIPAASLAEMEGILNHAAQLVTTIEGFYSQHAGQFDKTAKELEAASARATAGMAALDPAEFGARSIDYYRSLLNFNKAFADWSSEPFIPMYQHTLRVINSLAALVRGSLTCYKAKGIADLV
jgi:hypothetical protein